jgi:hypothetical protein
MLRELNRGLSIMLEVSKLSDFEFERREGAEKCFFKTKKRQRVSPATIQLLTFTSWRDLLSNVDKSLYERLLRTK